jgi:hypothetical protein
MVRWEKGRAYWTFVQARAMAPRRRSPSKRVAVARLAGLIDGVVEVVLLSAVTQPLGQVDQLR